MVLRTLCLLLLVLSMMPTGSGSLAEERTWTPHTDAGKWGRDLVHDAARDIVKDRILKLHKSWNAAGDISSLSIEPITEYVTGDADDDSAIGAALNFMENLVKYQLPEYQLIIDGGKLLIGGTVVVAAEGAYVAEDTVLRLSDIWSAYADGNQKTVIERAIFGTRAPLDAMLGVETRLLRDHSFLEHYLKNKRGIHPEDFGARIKTRGELERYWREYGVFLKSGLPLPREADRAELVKKTLQEAWPHVLNYWRAQRATAIVTRMQNNLIAGMAAMRRDPEFRRHVAAGMKCEIADSEGRWLPYDAKPACWCRSGYVWNAERTRCLLEPAAQVAAMRCADGEQAAWNKEQERVECQCAPGYAWNSDKTACVGERDARVEKARCFPNSTPYWNDEEKRVLCRCKADHLMNRLRDACIPRNDALVEATKCIPNSTPYWDEKTQSARCRCNAEFFMNRDRDACVPSATLVATAKCIPSSTPYWDEKTQRVHCRCNADLLINTGGTACIPRSEARVEGARCIPNSTPYWNEEKQRVHCRCNDDHLMNRSRDACVRRTEALVAAEKCFPNSTPYWNKKTQRVHCRCLDGHAWNERQDACLPQADATPDDIGMEAAVRALTDAMMRSQGMALPGDAVTTAPRGNAPQISEGQKPPPRAVLPAPPATPATKDCYSEADIARFQKELDCLREGRRKFPTTILDCNGSYMIGSRDGKVSNLEALIKEARACRSGRK